MNTKYLDFITHIYMTGKGPELTPGENLLALEYNHSVRQGFDILTIDEIIWEDRVESFVAALREAEIEEIYITNQASNMLGVYLMLEKLGLKISGVVELENAPHKEQMEKYGGSWLPATIPAMKLSFQ